MTWPPGHLSAINTLRPSSASRGPQAALQRHMKRALCHQGARTACVRVFQLAPTSPALSSRPLWMVLASIQAAKAHPHPTKEEERPIRRSRLLQKSHGAWCNGLSRMSPSCTERPRANRHCCTDTCIYDHRQTCGSITVQDHRSREAILPSWRAVGLVFRRLAMPELCHFGLRHRTS